MWSTAAHCYVKKNVTLSLSLLWAHILHYMRSFTTRCILCLPQWFLRCAVCIWVSFVLYAAWYLALHFLSNKLPRPICTCVRFLSSLRAATSTQTSFPLFENRLVWARLEVVPFVKNLDWHLMEASGCFRSLWVRLNQCLWQSSWMLLVLRGGPLDCWRSGVPSKLFLASLPWHVQLDCSCFDL